MLRSGGRGECTLEDVHVELVVWDVSVDVWFGCERCFSLFY